MTMAQDTIVFDTHEAVQELTTAGVPERQAEAHVRLQARLIEQNFATKRDIVELRDGLRGEIFQFGTELKLEIATLKQETRTEFAKVRTEMAELRAALKGDIDTLRQETRTEFAKVRTEMAELRAELKGEMAQLRADLTDKIDTSFRWLIGIQVGIAGILLAAIKLF